MIFPVAEIIAELSKLFELKSGDLIFTGTPAGVGPLLRGDRFRAELAGIAVLEGGIA
jgi:fumarylpyruvate hydrolase